ncbi:MAG: hypothetical protein JWR40_775 [Massilia sp.]|nr:hypothetical protein [Massilia sp.]MDB5951884.1 hypothetical protein [Massilia sp.]
MEAAFKGQGENAEAQTAQRDVAATSPLADKALRGAL